MAVSDTLSPIPARNPAPDPREAHKHPAPVHAPPPPRKVPLVTATMGAIASAEVQAIQLLACLPMPANLGPTVDTAA